jgi:acyl-CoA thioesterase-2
MVTIDAFVGALTMEPTGDDRYRASSIASEHNSVVFGGQLLAQSVMAGLAGQEGKTVKTIHTVFARAASPEAPLDIAVERMHGGRSVASSTVTISQGEQLCTRSLVLLSAEEPDVIRHADTPRSPSSPADLGEIRSTGAWEIGIVGDVDVNDPELVGPPELDVWVRFVGAPDDPATDQALVAYSTDGFLIGTAMRPHKGVGQAQAHVTLSTGVLSHTLTYHEPCPAGEWHLISQWSTYAGRGRTYGRGNIFRSDGQLAASFVQDAMIRARSGGPGRL